MIQKFTLLKMIPWDEDLENWMFDGTSPARRRSAQIVVLMSEETAEPAPFHDQGASSSVPLPMHLIQRSLG